MIKLTRLTFNMDGTAQQNLDAAFSLYEEAVKHAKLMDKPAPRKPSFDPKPNEYTQEENPYGIRLNEISDVSLSSDGFTAIEKTNGDIIAVKESVETVIALIDAEEMKFLKH